MTANIILTYRCPNHCPYCFADRTRSGPGEELTQEEFDCYVALLKRSGIHQPQLLGGEPFLHPRMDQFLQTLLSDESFGRVVIFTSGFVHPRYDPLLGHRKIALLANVNSPGDYPPGVFAKLTRNLERLADIPARLNLSYNIYRLDFDYQPVVDLAHRLGCKSLRWSVASPCGDGPTQHLDRDGRRRVVPRLLDFLQACVDAELEPNMDCPLEPCLLSEAQLGRLSRLLPAASVGDLRPCHCHPTLDLGPGYRVYRCVALGEAFSADVRQFENYEQVARHFHLTCDLLRLQAVPDECRSCEFFSRGDCTGGCLVPLRSRLLELRGTSGQGDSRLTSGGAALVAKACHQARKLLDAGNAAGFTRCMDEHTCMLRHADTPQAHVLWARYYALKGSPATSERHTRRARLLSAP